MKVIVFGSTGGTGRLLVSRALEDGHEVTAFARDAAALEARPGLTILTGATADVEAVDRAIEGQEAVLCALGGRPWRRRARVCSTAVRNIASSMTRHGVGRIIAISTFGAGNTRPLVGWFERNVLFGLVLRSEVADKEAMEDVLSATDLDWTAVRVGILTDEDARGTWRAADDDSVQGMGKIARADVAAFMVGELQSTTWLRRKPALMY